MDNYRPRRPMTFLSLVPSTSDSYPRTQAAQQQQQQQQPQPLTTEALAQVTKQEEEAAAAAATLPEAVAVPAAVDPTEATKRRTSSLSSDSSKLRFLKLGPVHWGEHQNEHKGDFHEVAVE